MAEISVDIRLRNAEEAIAELQRLDRAATDSAASVKGTGAAAAAAASGLDKQSSSARSAASALADMDGKSSKAGGSLGSLALSASKAAAVLGTVVAAAKTLSTVFSDVTQYDKLSAQMRTVIGSVDGATVAMEGLKALATDLPVELDDLTSSVIRLSTRGFDTSAEAIRSLSDLAAGLGGSFGQASEAIADLVVGQTARIEELGITATQENGKIQLAFGNTRVEVERSASAIQQALNKITLENFAGASAAQMESLTGKVSNLKDAVFNLSIAFGEAGGYDLFVGAINRAISVVNAASAEMKKLGVTWNYVKSVFRDPLNISSLKADADAAIAAIDQQAGATKNAAAEYDKLMQQRKVAFEARQAEIKAEADASAKASAARAAAEDAAKAAAQAAKARAQQIASDVAAQVQAVETYAERLTRVTAEINTLAAASKGAFGGEALIRAQAAALAEYGESVDAAYASEIQRAESSAKSASTLYEQIEASERLAALQRELADAKATAAFEAQAEGLVSQAAATRAATAAWEQYGAATRDLSFGAIVAEWERLNVQIDDSSRALQIAAEDMLRFGLAANQTQMGIGGVLAEVERAAETTGKTAAETADTYKSAWDEAARSTQRTLSDTFADVARNGIRSFRDLGDKLIDIMTSAAADVAAALVFEAVINPVIGSVTGRAASTAASTAASAAGSSASMSGVIEAIKSSTSAIGGWITSAAGSILPAITSVVTAMGPAVAGIIGAIGPIGIAVGAAAAVLGVLGVDLRGLLSNVIDASLAIPEAIFSAAGDLIESIVGAAADILSGIASAIGGVVTDAAGGVIGAVTDVVGGAFDAVGDVLGGIFHGGGIVGKTPVATRSLPASTWAGAPRLHNGTPTMSRPRLLPDEYPAILQRGEAVVPLQGGAIPVVGTVGGSSTEVNIIGAPSGTRTRRSGKRTDIVIGRIRREMVGSLSEVA